MDAFADWLLDLENITEKRNDKRQASAEPDCRTEID